MATTRKQLTSAPFQPTTALQHQELEPTDPGKDGELSVEGAVYNAVVLQVCAEGTASPESLHYYVSALRQRVEEVNNGNLKSLDALLSAQIIALNGLSAEMLRRALGCIQRSNLDGAERVMRLAFKAQAQCRATYETLSASKSPSIVYAKQANIANGPQQVNNGQMPSNSNAHIQHPIENETVPNELLDKKYG